MIIETAIQVLITVCCLVLGIVAAIIRVSSTLWPVGSNGIFYYVYTYGGFVTLTRLVNDP